MDELTSGSYQFEEESIQSYSTKELADFRNRKIGFIFQFHHLLPEFTAFENVLMPYMISRKSINREVRQRAEKYMDIVGILNRKDHMATNLSGGQQQRVAIARALMNEPSLVLADEPTGNLDTETTEQVYALLRKINDELGTTFIIVTHDRHIAAKSNRVIEIIDGQISRDIEVTGQKDIWDDT